MERDYTIKFDAAGAVQAAANINALAAAIAALNAQNAIFQQHAQAVQQNMSGVGQAAAAAQPNVNGMASGLGSIATQALLLNEARRAVEAMGGVFKESRQYAHEVAEEAAKLYDRLREIANLRHQDTGKTADQFLDMMGRTPASQQELATLSGEFEGAIDAARAQHTATGGKLGIDPKDKALAQGIQEDVATFAVRTGLDMSTAGRLSGVLGQYVPIKSRQGFMEHFGAMMNHLNVEGVAPMAQMGKPLLGLLADFAGEDGRIADPRDVSAEFAVATRAFRSPAMAATGMRQADRLIRKAMTNKDNDPELAALGITMDDDHISGLRKLAPRLAQKDAQFFLEKHKIGKNSTERDAVIKLGHLLGQMDVAMTDQDAQAEATRTMQRNREFTTADPAGKRRMAENRREVARLRVGTVETPYNTALIDAEARLTDRHEIDTDASRSMGLLYDAGDFASRQLGFPSYRERAIMREAERSLKERATAAGIDPDEAGAALRHGPMTPWGTAARNVLNPGGALVDFLTGATSDQGRRQQFGKLEKDTQAAEMQLEAAKINLEAAKARQAAGGGRGGAPALPQVGGVGVAPGRGGRLGG